MAAGADQPRRQPLRAYPDAGGQSENDRSTKRDMTAPNPVVRVGSLEIGNAKPLSIIAGPCALESRDHALEMASALKEIAAKAGVGFIYKTSFDKANRTSANSVRGLGIELALPIFAEIRESIGIPVLTDVHEIDQCALAAEAADVLQIPAF